MATPKWFDANVYMQNKLAQLKAQEPDANWSWDNLYDAFRDADFVGEEGQYEHFVKFGAAEEVAPNAYFNADEYYAAKAKQYYEEVLKQEFTGSEEQIAHVKSLIKNEGMNAWTHYQQFGSAEGVDPSNAFDASAYCAAKAEAMNKAGQKAPDGTEWTAEKIADAIADAGMSVLEHYLTYAGTGEGEVAAGSTYPVADDEQVSKPGETFYLTADRDSLVGTSGDDVFRATTAEDMDDFDTVDGGAGNDTLEVYTGDALKGTFTNIENLVVAGTTAAVSYDLSSFSKSFTLKADAATKVMNVAGQKLVMDGVDAKALTVEMAANQASVELVSQNRTGENTFTLDKGDALKSVSLTLDEAASSVKFAGTKVGSIETLAVKAVESSTANVATVDLTSLAGLKDITVTGDASVTLSAVNTATKLETLDASNTTGGVTVDGLANTAAFTGGEGNDTITLGASTQAHDMGAGDDTVTITEALGKGVSINGGDGIDTLEMTTNIAKDFRVGDAITGFETLKLTTGTDTVDMDNFGDINHVIAGSQAATIKNIDSNGTIEFNDNGAAMTVTVKGADKADNTSDVLNVTIADDGNVTVQKLTVANVENINITADDTDLGEDDTPVQHTMALTADKATNVNISGDAALNLTLTGSDEITKIDASGNTGGLTVDLSTIDTAGKYAVTLTGSSADDTITMGIGNVITGGEGKDAFTATQATGVNATVSYSTIMDFEVGDTLTIGSRASDVKKVVLTEEMTFDQAVNTALAAVSTEVAWFEYKGNTYVVADNDGSGDTFGANDYIVKLNGIVDLSDADVAGGVLSLPEGA